MNPVSVEVEVEVDPTAYDRNRRRFGKADDELVGFFSAALGVKAQNLDSSGGAFNSHEAHWGRLQAMQRGQLAWYDAVAATLGQLPALHRRVLVVVYSPHAAPTWLQDALSTPWGGGSFVALATAQPRALTAAAERNGESIAWDSTPKDAGPVSQRPVRYGVVRKSYKGGETVLDWLIRRGRGASENLLKSLREDCEALRMPALAAYEELRKARVKAKLVADKERADKRSERNMRLYTELTGKRERKVRERRARKTGIAA